MNNIQRICEKCGEGGALDARYCPHCGYDSQGIGGAALPAPRLQLPVALGKAALPLLAGAASLALRAGWKLLQRRLANTTPEQAANAFTHFVQRATPPAPTQPLAPRQETPVQRRPRRTIHIRSNWAVGDVNGVWRQGSSEHTIEIDE